MCGCVLVLGDLGAQQWGGVGKGAQLLREAVLNTGSQQHPCACVIACLVPALLQVWFMDSCNDCIYLK